MSEPIQATPQTYRLALLDPGAVFTAPNDVVAARGLTAEQKIEILRRWEYDARVLSVAEEENMRGRDGDLLLDIHEALRALGAKIDEEHAPPTKEGGI